MARLQTNYAGARGRKSISKSNDLLGLLTQVTAT